jgi:hypothetical protein
MVVAAALAGLERVIYLGGLGQAPDNSAAFSQLDLQGGAARHGREFEKALGNGPQAILSWPDLSFCVTFLFQTRTFSKKQSCFRRSGYEPD